MTFHLRPLLSMGLLACLLGLALILIRRRDPALLLLRRVGEGILVAGVPAYVALVVWYCSDAHFFDSAEPTVVSNAWMLRLGEPVYHSLDTAVRYAHIYGPLAFAIPAAWLWLTGPGIVATKALAGAVALLAMALFATVVSWTNGSRRAFCWTGALAWCFLNYQQRSFWVRPEPFELFAVVVSLALASSKHRWSGAIGLGVCIGVIANLKFTGPLYLLAPGAFFLARHGIRWVFPIAVVAILTLPAPFLFIDGVEWRPFYQWVQLSANTGLLFTLLQQNLEAATFFVAFPFLAYHAAGKPDLTRPQRWSAGALVGGMSLVCLAAAKPGGGPYHLIPFIPVVLWLAASYTGRAAITFRGIMLPALSGGIVVALLAIATFQVDRFIDIMRQRMALHEPADMLTFLGSHPGVVAMGYGLDEPLSLARPVLVFRTGINPIDQPAIREYQLQGLTIPDATLGAIQDCGIRYWFIPAGEPPFSAKNTYPSVLGRDLYPETFQELFRTSHRVTATTDYYDVWECVAENER